MRNLIILALFSLVLMGCQTPPPPKVEKASEFTGGGRALKPGEW